MTCKKSKDQRYYQSRCSKFRAELLNRQTPSELKFAKMLQEHEIAFIPQKAFCSKGMSCIVDFYLPKYKLCVEIDGPYHFEDDQFEKDQHRDRYLTFTRRLGVLRIPNRMCEDEQIILSVKRRSYGRGTRTAFPQDEFILE